MKKPKYGNNKCYLKNVSAFDNENDVEFNHNLSLNVTNTNIHQHELHDVSVSGAKIEDGINIIANKKTQDKHNQNNLSENTHNKPMMMLNKFKEEKNVLLLKSIYPNRPKVIFFQYPKSIQIQKNTQNRVTKISNSCSKVQLK
jgi:hypothetical protein